MPDADIARFRRELQAFDRKVRNKVLRDALKGACKILADEVRANAPEATGALRASVKVKSGRRKKDVISMAVVETGGHDRPIPAHVEYGTSIMVAKPHFRPAIGRKEGEMIESVEQEIAGAIGGAGM